MALSAGEKNSLTAMRILISGRFLVNKRRRRAAAAEKNSAPDDEDAARPERLLRGAERRARIREAKKGRARSRGKKETWRAGESVLLRAQVKGRGERESRERERHRKRKPLMGARAES